MLAEHPAPEIAIDRIQAWGDQDCPAARYRDGRHRPMHRPRRNIGLSKEPQHGHRVRASSDHG
ncbi:hypothetical protein X949_5985 [Burkholderia pseudomallei MSHR5609]|nr:hypothetical protein DO64_3154 [Burkholderia pseudomallei]KGS19773.1 hypothetical protein X989_4079 [Burkholderia pseudomallei MSHR4378]KGS53063.1 hypothetical protein X949_5985 [Burkholderia pseudomallei MSHR5609]KGX55299.1 hypothetical protein Y025_4164 [Burkholderia pseudomallei TSV32]KGX61730.1 hypothetical protein Y027_2283 [Burkholderia pseudomallei TSV5]